MGLMKPVMDFLFGKDPDIFDENGNVIHKHPKKKWEAWQNRFKTNPDYNWRNHTGTSSTGNQQQQNQSKK